jgi:MoaA/NifB/PqqE/SkfB family radical SAM enzyme
LRKCWQGYPYLQKELLREISVKTNVMLATPASYYVMCTFRCNFRCTHCPQVASRADAPYELSRQTLLRIITESKELSGRGYNISVSGGEPLLHPHIFEAMELAHKLGVDFGLTTNGYLLTPENIKRIVGADLFNINISIESVDPAINELIRPLPGATERVLKAVDTLLAEKERAAARFGIFLKPTVTELNYRSLPEMVRRFGKGSAVQVNPQAFYHVPGAEAFWIKDPEALSAVVEELIALRTEGYGLVPSPETLRDMVAYFRTPAATAPPSDATPATPSTKECHIGFRNFFINPDGMAFFCEPLGRIGNITNTSLRDVWFGPEAQKKRRVALRCPINCQMTCRRPTSLLTRARAFLRMG